jgi:hypothetical protein
MPTLKIRNLIKRVNNLQMQISLERVRQASKSANSFYKFSNDISTYCQISVAQAKQIIDDQNKTVADLPIRSRRAYQWLTHLSDPENMSFHLDALQRILLHTQKGEPRMFDFSFYHLGPLYQVREKKQTQKIVVQEAFVQAPDNVLSAFLELLSNERKNLASMLIKEYALTDEYRNMRTRLEYLDIPRGSFAEGEFYNLADSFQRVNQQYFEGNSSQPHLVWSTRLTYRKFGHYQWDIDTIMISKTLDDPSVPAFLVDYIMYHELLHKKMGLKITNRRKIAHTSAFKAVEKQFAQYEDARKELGHISRKKSR